MLSQEYQGTTGSSLLLSGPLSLNSVYLLCRVMCGIWCWHSLGHNSWLRRVPSSGNLFWASCSLFNLWGDASDSLPMFFPISLLCHLRELNSSVVFSGYCSMLSLHYFSFLESLLIMLTRSPSFIIIRNAIIWRCFNVPALAITENCAQWYYMQ